MWGTLILGLAVLVPSEELASPVRLEAGGKVIDTDVGHAAPFVADFDGDGKQDLLVGDYATLKPDLPEPTDEEKAEHKRVQKELDGVMEEYREYGKKMREADKEGRKKLSEEMSGLLKKMADLRSKLPKETESHGWIWLFLRTW